VRLFIGVELDDGVRDSAAAIANSLRRHLGRRVDARWIPVSNLHITLWFIGNVPDDRTDAILRSLDRPFTIPVFDIHIAGLGAFPPSGAPRVFWLGVQSGAEHLAGLHGALSARLLPVGIEPERRAYSAHLTIARVKGVRGGETLTDVRASLRQVPADAGACRVAGITVFRSHLSPKGATYEALLRVPLQ
jgi:RNA 2',3'-cyclic 3'-phosphodiesterase